MNNIKIMAVFGTRPEAVKMCPLVLELNKHTDIKTVVCLTGQHKQMLRQVIDIFGIKTDEQLNIMKPKQSLESITAGILEGMESVFLREKPDLVLVHGDTSTSFSVALGAFYHKIPVGHVEAGLRSFHKYSPFPEEMNRLLTSRIAQLHFSPTSENRSNLEAEGIAENIFVTGNTGLDAFAVTIRENYGNVHRCKGICCHAEHRKSIRRRPCQRPDCRRDIKLVGRTARRLIITGIIERHHKKAQGASRSRCFFYNVIESRALS